MPWRQTTALHGTAASLRGTGEALLKRDPKIALMAVEPAESAVLSGGPTGAHKIDGVGAGYVVPLWRADLIEALARRQRDDGSWVNENNRWLEGDANLVTGYALLALSYAR